MKLHIYFWRQRHLNLRYLRDEGLIRVAVILSLLITTPVLAKSAASTFKVSITKGKDSPVCQEVVKKIKSAPDFFKRFEKEQFKYILFDSPFKRNDIEIVPKSLYYASYLQSRAFKLTASVNSVLRYSSMRVEDGCKDYPKYLQNCEKEIMESFLNIESEKKSIDFINDAYLENDRAFAYKTKTNIYSHSKIEEYALGAVGNWPYGEVKDNPLATICSC